MPSELFQGPVPDSHCAELLLVSEPTPRGILYSMQTKTEGGFGPQNCSAMGSCWMWRSCRTFASLGQVLGELFVEVRGQFVGSFPWDLGSRRKTAIWSETESEHLQRATCEVESLKLQESCNSCTWHELWPYHSIPDSNPSPCRFFQDSPAWRLEPFALITFFLEAFYRAAAMNALQLLLQQQLGGWLSLSCFGCFVYLFFRNLSFLRVILTAAKAACPLRRLMACNIAARKREERVRERDRDVQSLPGNCFLYFQPRGSSFYLVVFDPFD